MSVSTRVLNALQTGEELTAKQISARYGVANARAVIHQLRVSGFPVYLNERVNAKGVKTRKYRLGTPTKSMVALAAEMGYFSN